METHLHHAGVGSCPVASRIVRWSPARGQTGLRARVCFNARAQSVHVSVRCFSVLVSKCRYLHVHVWDACVHFRAKHLNAHVCGILVSVACNFSCVKYLVDNIIPSLHVHVCGILVSAACSFSCVTCLPEMTQYPLITPALIFCTIRGQKYIVLAILAKRRLKKVSVLQVLRSGGREPCVHRGELLNRLAADLGCQRTPAQPTQTSR